MNVELWLAELVPLPEPVLLLDPGEVVVDVPPLLVEPGEPMVPLPPQANIMLNDARARNRVHGRRRDIDTIPSRGNTAS